MLGHLVPSQCHQSAASKLIYRKLYCGICRSLRKESGLASSLFINHELSLNLLALSPYIQTNDCTTSCPATAFTQQKTTFEHKAVTQAGYLSLLLAWLKASDWAFDSTKKRAKLVQFFTTKKKEKIWQNIPKNLQAQLLDYLQKIKNTDPTSAIIEDASGNLAKQLWLHLSDFSTMPAKQKALHSQLFYYSGRLIYIADALLDVLKDQQNEEFNPILKTQANFSFKQAFQKYYWKFHLLFLTCEAYLKKLDTNSAFYKTYHSALHQLRQKVTQQRNMIFGEIDPEQINVLLNMQAFWGKLAVQCPCELCKNCCNGCEQCGKGCGNCCGQCNIGNTCSDCMKNCTSCCNNCKGCDCSGESCACDVCSCETSSPKKTPLDFPDIENLPDSTRQKLEQLKELLQKEDLDTKDLEQILEKMEQ